MTLADTQICCLPAYRGLSSGGKEVARTASVRAVQSPSTLESSAVRPSGHDAGTAKWGPRNDDFAAMPFHCALHYRETQTKSGVGPFHIARIELNKRIKGSDPFLFRNTGPIVIDQKRVYTTICFEGDLHLVPSVPHRVV